MFRIASLRELCAQSAELTSEVTFKTDRFIQGEGGTQSTTPTTLYSNGMWGLIACNSTRGSTRLATVQALTFVLLELVGVETFYLTGPALFSPSGA